MRYQSLASVAALALLGAWCASSLAAQPPAPAAPLGGPCAKRADCVRGLMCLVGTCELPGPCSATTTFTVDGQPRTSRVGFAYDTDGYELSRVETGDRQSRSETFINRLDHTRTTTTWDADPVRPAEIEIARVDADERAFEVTTISDAGDRELRTLVSYGGPEECARRSYTVRRLPDGLLTGRVEVRCVGRRPVEERALSVDADSHETLLSTTTYRYDATGRLMGKTIKRVGGGRMSWAYVRDEGGRINGLTSDYEDDGTADTTEVWDLGCWKVTPDVVIHQPGRD